MNEKSHEMPLHYRRNFAALLADFAFFGMAFTFFSPNNVLPAFADQLTDSEPLIGLGATLFHGGWLLPQLVAARLIADRPRKKPFLLTWVLSGRTVFWLLALALSLGVARYTKATLVLFFVCIGVWAITDGLGSVAWFDIMARAIPARRRGRLIGTAQFVSGIAGIGTGALLGLVLERLPFPANYALVFALAGAFLIPSTIAILLLREPPPAGEPPRRERERQRASRLGLLATDPTFRRLMVCRILIAMLGLSVSFFVVHATAELHMPPQVVGDFAIAQRSAGIAASLLLGLVCERWGPRYVIRAGATAAVAAPLIALAAHVAGGWPARAYPLVFAALGTVDVTYMLGFFNYLLETAPAGSYPAYVGQGNTIVGLTTLAPLLGGWLLRATSYTVLFGVTAMAVTIGLVLTMRLQPAGHDDPGGAEQNDNG